MKADVMVEAEVLSLSPCTLPSAAVPPSVIPSAAGNVFGAQGMHHRPNTHPPTPPDNVIIRPAAIQIAAVIEKAIELHGRCSSRAPHPLTPLPQGLPIHPFLKISGHFTGQLDILFNNAGGDNFMSNSSLSRTRMLSLDEASG